jgi:hypothetical protein
VLITGIVSSRPMVCRGLPGAPARPCQQPRNPANQRPVLGGQHMTKTFLASPDSLRSARLFMPP